MKFLLSLFATSFLMLGSANAAEEFLGPWASGEKEVLQITQEGGNLSAEFIRENVKYEFEKVRFPATLKDGSLVITGDQGDVTAQFDPARNLLILGGLKAFQKLSPQQAATIISNLEKN